MTSEQLKFPQNNNHKLKSLNLADCDQSLLSEFDHLISDAKNFNLHVTILKQLLNLEEQKKRYNFYMRPHSLDQSLKKKNCQNITSNDHLALVEKLEELRKEMDQSHYLGFCLAYNIQCFQKRLTGFPIDINSGTNLIASLKEKYENSKAREALIKYDFQEKRKLLNRLRSQLEETRNDWRNIRIKKPRKKMEEEMDSFWSEILTKRFGRKQLSEESWFGEKATSSAGNESDVQDSNSSEQLKVEKGGYEKLAAAMHLRKKKLDQLEEECYNLFSNLSNKCIKSESFTQKEKEKSPMLEVFINDLINEEDLISESFSNEMDNIQLNQIYMVDPGDNTEETDVVHLSWDSNMNGSLAVSNNENISHLDNHSSNSEEDSSSNHEKEVITKNEELLMLRRLRRRAVKTLISRLKDEKFLYQRKETYLKEQLREIQLFNQDLKSKLEQLGSQSFFQICNMAIIGGVIISILIGFFYKHF